MRKNCPIIIIRNYFNLENLVYYLQVFLKECKHILKNNDLESSFDEKKKKAKHQNVFLRKKF